MSNDNWLKFFVLIVLVNKSAIKISLIGYVNLKSFMITFINTHKTGES